MSESDTTQNWTPEQRIKFLEEQLVAANDRLDKIDPKPRKPISESVERYLEMALGRMDGDPVKAAALFLAWTQQDSQVAESLTPIIQEVIETRLAKIPHPEPEPA